LIAVATFLKPGAGLRCPITSLRYFIGLIEEVGQTNTPDSYWQHVRLKAEQLERQWLQRHGRDAVPLR